MNASAPDRITPLRSALRRLGGYIGRNRGYYALWLATTLAYVATFVTIPVLIGEILGLVARDAPHPEVQAAIWRLVGITVVSAVVRFFSRTLGFNAAREIEYEIRNDIFAHLQKLPQSFYARWRTGDIMSRCVNDINAVRLLMGVGLLNLLQTPVLYVAVIGAMMTVNAPPPLR